MTVDERGTRAARTSALVPGRVPSRTRAAVLFLHGGRADSRAPSRPWHPAALRMRPFAGAVAGALPDDGVLLARVRYRVRGWNGAASDPLHDADRALVELARLVGEVPVILVGHSMGGRAALRVAGAASVRGVLALAPWCPDGEPVAQLRDRDLVVLHGDGDRVTDPAASRSFAERAGAAGARAGFRVVPGGDHAMLRHAGVWHRTAGSVVAEWLSR
ncbi:alpha/beta hydrolase [Streptomyces sp. HUAS MG91]|uniref:Alpha/beta hydrolase n=1 Tax=Streptomyces tabacisoli TaxID=3156398 RepID=A0AAU8IKW4_9ACTN